MGSFSDKFKNDSLRGTVNKLQEKYRPQDIKHMSQGRAVEVLEREKSLEKDDKMRGNYDIIIQAIKEFFAKKYGAEQARRYALESARNVIFSKIVMEILKSHPELEQLAKQELGKQFVEDLKKNNVYTKAQGSGWVKSLT